MFIAPPPGYEIRENAYCKPHLDRLYGTLDEAIKGCPSCMITGFDGGFFTCEADAEIIVSAIGFRVYIKSK